jgi:hypothetical protein
MAKKSPKDTPCLYCGKKFTSKGVYEHERHACPKNPHRKKRSFGKLRCHVCGQMYHAAGLRTHMATQHPIEYAKQKRKRPSSKASMRRRVARAESEERQRHDVPRSRGSAKNAEPPIPRNWTAPDTCSHAPSPHDQKHRHNTDSKAMAQIQREMQRAAAAN